MSRERIGEDSGQAVAKLVRKLRGRGISMEEIMSEMMLNLATVAAFEKISVEDFVSTAKEYAEGAKRTYDEQSGPSA